MTASAYPKTGALRDTAASDDGSIAPDDIHELALMRRIKAGDFDMRQQLVTCNLLHVLRSNRCYAKSGAGIFDLLKAGERGLAHALENFEPEGKSCFSAYAASCIRRHIELVLSPQRPQPVRTSKGGSSGLCPQCP